ncbi:MAG TPA: LamG domain-containing protein [Thermoanaerobaculia bacterium]|nr:LamG domain-containing protein [Thermoanaerobaculia bacterium]
MKKLVASTTFVVVLSISAPALAQPYGSYLEVQQGHGYVSYTLANTAYAFSNGITLEGWLYLYAASEVCGTILGRNYETAYWVAVCGLTLRSRLRGNGSDRDGGLLPIGRWTHFAVTFDGTTRRHYINGEEAGAWPDPGPIGSSSSELRLGSDIRWQISPRGAFDEIRAWDRALTTDEIRKGINTPLTPPQPNLAGVFHLDNNAIESVSGEHGTPAGTCQYKKLSSSSCTTTDEMLCLDHRFAVRVDYFLESSSGAAKVVNFNTESSGLFWFFGADNWEVLVKALNGCALNERKWIFAASTTNIRYDMTVTDTQTGAVKHYLNFQGVSAPAITDTEAFRTCP